MDSKIIKIINKKEINENFFLKDKLEKNILKYIKIKKKLKIGGKEKLKKIITQGYYLGRYLLRNKNIRSIKMIKIKNNSKVKIKYNKRNIYKNNNIIYKYFYKKKEKIEKEIKKRNVLNYIIKLEYINIVNRDIYYKELKEINRNVSKTRHKNICLETLRKCGIYKRFRLSRIMLKEKIKLGEMPGLKKFSK